MISLLGLLLHPTILQTLAFFCEWNCSPNLYRFLQSYVKINPFNWVKKLSFSFIRLSFTNGKYMSTPILPVLIKFSTTILPGTNQVSSVALHFFLIISTLLLHSLLATGVHFFMICICFYDVLAFKCILSDRLCLTFTWIWDVVNHVLT